MIDKSKSYKTRSGHDVRIYATDCGGNWPVHGAIFNECRWSPTLWTADGCMCDDEQTHQSDLLESRPLVHVRWSQPTTRPWTRAEFPMSAPVWLRSYEGESMALLVTRVDASGVCMGTPYQGIYSWATIASNYQFSIDGKTWHPCAVVVND